MSRPKDDLHTKLINGLRVKHCRIRRKLRLTNAEQMSESLRPTCKKCQDISQLPARTKLIVVSQLKAIRKKKKGMPWSVETKSLAISYYYKSPSLYKDLTSSLFLPSIPTLKRSGRR